MKEITDGNGKVIGWQDKPSPELRLLIEICDKNDRERLKEAIGSGFYDQVVKAVSYMDDKEVGLLLKVVAKMKRSNKKEEGM
jgi:hypothetical protein